MPSEKILEQKKQVVADLCEKLKNSASGVLVDYSGTSVANDTKLRKNLREAGVNYSVVKNTLVKFAAKEAGLEGLDDVLNGTTALATSENDLVAPAKILSEFAKDNENFKIKAGFIEEKVVSLAEVEALAKLPSKEVLLAQVLGGLNAPITGFANVLNGNIRGLVIALNAIAQQKA